MFNVRYKSHHDVGSVISRLVKSEKASEQDFLKILNSTNPTKQLGIYFHTPYCDKICSFCNMNREKLENDLQDYTEYLCEEIRKKSSFPYCQSSLLDVVFFGGGTPTIYTSPQLEKILKTLKSHFQFSDNYEMTFETTLHNLSLKKLAILEKYGVNRLSIGVQTFSERGRKILNRSYGKEYAIKRVRELREKFSGLICIDIIYNYAFQTEKEVLEDAEILSSLGIDSVSFYSLMIHEGSEMSKESKNKNHYSLEQDEKLHNLFYQKCIEKGYQVLELTKLTNGRDCYQYIQNNNRSKNLLPLGVGAGGHLENISCYQFNQRMAFYSKSPPLAQSLSMISGMMQFPSFSLSELAHYALAAYPAALEKLKEYEREGCLKIEEDRVIYQQKGIFWGNSLSAEIIKEIFQNTKQIGGENENINCIF